MGKSLDPGRAFGGRYNVGGWESGCLMRAMNEAVAWSGRRTVTAGERGVLNWRMTGLGVCK